MSPFGKLEENIRPVPFRSVLSLCAGLVPVPVFTSKVIKHVRDYNAYHTRTLLNISGSSFIYSALPMFQMQWLGCETE